MLRRTRLLDPWEEQGRRTWRRGHVAQETQPRVTNRETRLYLHRSAVILLRLIIECLDSREQTFPFHRRDDPR